MFWTASSPHPARPQQLFLEIGLPCALCPKPNNCAAAHISAHMHKSVKSEIGCSTQHHCVALKGGSAHTKNEGSFSSGGPSSSRTAQNLTADRSPRRVAGWGGGCKGSSAASLAPLSTARPHRSTGSTPGIAKACEQTRKGMPLTTPHCPTPHGPQREKSDERVIVLFLYLRHQISPLDIFDLTEQHRSASALKVSFIVSAGVWRGSHPGHR
jgi:hypothetical protein